MTKTTTSTLTRAASLAALVLSLTTAACSDMTGPASNNVSISVDVNDRAMVAGQTAEFRLIVERPDGFTGQVALMTEGLPKGVRAEFTRKTLEDGQLESVLTLIASDSVTSSRSIIKVGASGLGVKARGASIQLWISPDSTSNQIKQRPTTPGWAPGSDKGGN